MSCDKVSVSKLLRDRDPAAVSVVAGVAFGSFLFGVLLSVTTYWFEISRRTKSQIKALPRQLQLPASYENPATPRKQISEDREYSGRRLSGGFARQGKAWHFPSQDSIHTQTEKSSYYMDSASIRGRPSTSRSTREFPLRSYVYPSLSRAASQTSVTLTNKSFNETKYEAVTKPKQTRPKAIDTTRDYRGTSEWPYALRSAPFSNTETLRPPSPTTPVEDGHTRNQFVYAPEPSYLPYLEGAASPTVSKFVNPFPTPPPSGSFNSTFDMSPKRQPSSRSTSSVSMVSRRKLTIQVSNTKNPDDFDSKSPAPLPTPLTTTTEGSTLHDILNEMDKEDPFRCTTPLHVRNVSAGRAVSFYTQQVTDHLEFQANSSPTSTLMRVLPESPCGVRGIGSVEDDSEYFSGPDIRIYSP